MTDLAVVALIKDEILHVRRRNSNGSWNFWQGLWYRWVVDMEIGKLRSQSKGK